MRLLHERHDHDGAGAARSDAEADGRTGEAGARRLPVPVRHAYQDRPRGATRVARQREDGMSTLSRRDILRTGGGLIVAFTLSSRRGGAQTATTPGFAGKPVDG